MEKWFQSRSVGMKLMIISSFLVLFFFGIFTYFISSFSSSIIEKNSVADLKNQTELVRECVEVFSNNVKKNTNDLSNVFVSYFPARFSVEPDKRVTVGAISTPVLKNGSEVLNLNFKSIDKFTQMTGAVATVFVREGDDFARITTSLKKEDGSRAIGTLLGKSHPAYPSLMKGDGYLGRALLFGKMYSTKYVPIKDGSGQVIGVLFVGLEITDGLNFLKEKIKTIKIGDTGYIFALDSTEGANRGNYTLHPTQEGKNALEAKDAGGKQFVKEMLKNKRGVISYRALAGERGETKARDMVVAYTSFDEWNWVIAAGAYRDELTSGAVVLRRYMIAATCAITALLLLCLHMASRRMVTLPLSRAVAFARTVAAGDLTKTLEVRSEDEVGALSGALNSMVSGIKQMIGRIRETSEQVATAASQISVNSEELTRSAHSQSSASEETSSTIVQMAVSIESVANNADALASNTEEVSSAMEQLGASGEQVAKSAEMMTDAVSETSATIEQMTVSIEKVAQNAEELASSVTETSSTIEQMTVSIDQVADRSKELQKVVGDASSIVCQMGASIRETADRVAEADQVARTAAREGAHGQEAVRKALGAMKRVAEVSESTSASIANLGKRSEEIGDIVKVIGAIADQTNLLALNAAIEAARAGDAGRGFAVVADEVRKLAERSVTATKEIAEVISQVQADTGASVRYGELASREAIASMELSEVAGNALVNIVKSIEQTSGLMSEVATMASEQAAASEQVVKEVEKMSAFTEVVANAAKEQALGGRQIRMSVERMNSITVEVAGATREQAMGSRQIRGAVENMTRVTKQVSLATREQAQSACQVMTTVGAMNDMTRAVALATSEQKSGGDLVVAAMDNISDAARRNLASLEDLSVSAQNLSRQAVDLAGLVAQFSV